MRLKHKKTRPILVTEPTDRPDFVSILRERRRPKVVDDFEMSEPENVDSLANHRPGTRRYQVSLSFSGEAGTAIGELMTGLEVDNPNDVALRAIALLVSARGKEILLRDLETGTFETVEV